MIGPERDWMSLLFVNNNNINNNILENSRDRPYNVETERWKVHQHEFGGQRFADRPGAEAQVDHQL